jgi:hypothetical protein
MEKNWEYNDTARRLFIHFKTAYNSVQKYCITFSLNWYTRHYLGPGLLKYIYCRVRLKSAGQVNICGKAISYSSDMQKGQIRHCFSASLYSILLGLCKKLRSELNRKEEISSCSVFMVLVYGVKA